MQELVSEIHGGVHNTCTVCANGISHMTNVDGIKELILGILFDEYLQVEIVVIFGHKEMDLAHDCENIQALFGLRRKVSSQLNDFFSFHTHTHAHTCTHMHMHTRELHPSLLSDLPVIHYTLIKSILFKNMHLLFPYRLLVQASGKEARGPLDPRNIFERPSCAFERRYPSHARQQW